MNTPHPADLVERARALYEEAHATVKEPWTPWDDLDLTKPYDVALTRLAFRMARESLGLIPAENTEGDF